MATTEPGVGGVRVSATCSRSTARRRYRFPPGVEVVCCPTGADGSTCDEQPDPSTIDCTGPDGGHPDVHLDFSAEHPWEGTGGQLFVMAAGSPEWTGPFGFDLQPPPSGLRATGRMAMLARRAV
jgi:hypothetical protein